MSTKRDLRFTYGEDLKEQFTLYTDVRLTTWRGQWNSFRVYQPGEGVENAYLATMPLGSAVGPLRAYIATLTTEHQQPGEPGAQAFWSPMTPTNLNGAELVMTVEGVFTQVLPNAHPSEGEVNIHVKPVQFSTAPRAARWNLKLTEASGVVSYPIIGTAVFRNP